jgi:competence protein ComEC
MVDCGGSSDAEAADAAAEALLSQGITKLDVLILTHYDKDHSGAVDELLSRVDAELLILPPVYSELQLPAKQTVYATQDLTITTQKMKTEIYAPVIPEGGNENSLCILFDTEKCDILITGDCNAFAERMLLRRVNLPDVDILVAGHHGSGGSTSEELLSRVRPEIVCISAGQNNRYGHPASELLQRLEHYGCNIYRTDIHGDIMVRR